MKRQTMKQGRRPRDLQLAVKHYERKAARRDLRTYRYLRMPQLFLADVAVGAGMGFGVLAIAMLAVGLAR